MLIERIRSRFLIFPLKFALFNLSLGGMYAVMISLLGLEEVLASFGDFGQYGIAIFWILLNVTFLVYDFAVGRMTLLYICWFRPRFLRRVS